MQFIRSENHCSKDRWPWKGAGEESDVTMSQGSKAGPFRVKVRGKDSNLEGLSLRRGASGDPKVESRKVRLLPRAMPNRSSSPSRDGPSPLGPAFLTLSEDCSAECLMADALPVGSGLQWYSEERAPRQWEGQNPVPVLQGVPSALVLGRVQARQGLSPSGVLSFLLSSLTHTSTGALETVVPSSESQRPGMEALMGSTGKAGSAAEGTRCLASSI